ncbi:MAG: murein biosynthesis integral membrane protein MurJ [Verrucomicrobiota bacterium]|nr:murein biosynthesis integral membrane protein MurJ [Verrucomicrobiota bacterium]
MNKRKETARSAGIIGIFVMISRVLGLIREQLFAFFFGASPLTSVFLTAFRIPNLLRDLFAEGALSSAFVTTFTKKLHLEGDTAAWRLANMVTNALLLIVGSIVVLGILFGPYLPLAPDRNFTPDQQGLLANMIRIMFPFLLLVSMASVSMGILNAKNNFAIPASASSFFNIGSIFGGFGLAFVFESIWGQPNVSWSSWTSIKQYVVHPEFGFPAMYGLAVGVLIGGFFQWLIQQPALRKVGYRYEAVLDPKDAGLKQVGLLMGPAVIATSAIQINVLVNTIFANHVSGEATSYLYYAFRFLQLPLGVFGVAVATAMLPSISRSAADNDMGNFQESLTHALQLVVFLTIPSTAGLILLGDGIVGTVYQIGHNFTAADTHATHMALQAYSFALIAYCIVKIIGPAFYALGESRKPMLVSLGAIVVNFVINYLLIMHFGFGHAGLAMGTSIVICVNALTLMFMMHNRIKVWNLGPLWNTVSRVCGATVLMCVSGFLLHTLWGLNVGRDLWILRAADLALSMSGCLLTFWFGCRLFGVTEFDEFIQLIRKRRGKPTGPTP